MAQCIALPVSARVIAAAVEVHETIGPGLVASVYDQCLAYELANLNIRFRRQVPVPVVYRGARISCGYRAGFIVEGTLLVEPKAEECLLPLHDAQSLTYLRLLHLPRGLIINFNVRNLIDGVRNVMNEPRDRARGPAA